MPSFDGWNDELYHHGIKGQKWGIRRYQNPDGTLTEAGKQRYFNNDRMLNRRGRKEYMRQYKTASKLIDRANLSKQADNYLKYQKRKITSSKIAGGLATAATAALGGGKFAAQKALGNGMKKAFSWKNAADWQLNENHNYGKMKDYDTIAKIWGKDAVEKHKAYTSLSNKVALSLTAGAAVAGGVALYNRHKELAAKMLLSQAGHTKAVEEAKDYVAKMNNAFGNVSVANLKKKAS